WAIPLLALACFIDGQWSSPLRGPIEPSNRRLGLCAVWHLDKTEAPRAAGLAICDDLSAIDDAIGFEQLFQLIFRRLPSQIAYKNTHAHLLSCTSSACPLRLSCSFAIRRGRDHRGGAVVVIGDALDTLTLHDGGLPPGTEMDGAPGDPLVCPKKRGCGYG